MNPLSLWFTIGFVLILVWAVRESKKIRKEVVPTQERVSIYRSSSTHLQFVIYLLSLSIAGLIKIWFFSYKLHISLDTPELKVVFSFISTVLCGAIVAEFIKPKNNHRYFFTALLGVCQAILLSSTTIVSGK